MQSSGTKKRQIAKERAAKDKLSVETTPKLDRYIVHSEVKVHDDAHAAPQIQINSRLH